VGYAKKIVGFFFSFMPQLFSSSHLTSDAYCKPIHAKTSKVLKTLRGVAGTLPLNIKFSDLLSPSCYKNNSSAFFSALLLFYIKKPN